MLSQIVANGIGSDLYNEAKISGSDSVRIKNLITYVYVQTNGIKIIEYMAR